LCQKENSKNIVTVSKVPYVIFVMLILDILSCQLKILSVNSRNVQKKNYNL